MIKGLATIFVGMFMLLLSAPMAWSVGERAGGVETGEGTFRGQEESSNEDPSTNFLSGLEANHTFDQMGFMQQIITSYRGVVPAPSGPNGNPQNQTSTPLVAGGENIENVANEDGETVTFENQEVTAEIIKQYNQDENLVATLVRISNSTVNSTENGRIFLVSASINVVAPEEADGLVALLVITNSTINTGKLILVDENGTIVTEVPILIDMNGNIRAAEVGANTGSKTIISTTTEAAIQLDGSNVTSLGGGNFQHNWQKRVCGPTGENRERHNQSI